MAEARFSRRSLAICCSAAVHSAFFFVLALTQSPPRGVFATAAMPAARLEGLSGAPRPASIMPRPAVIPPKRTVAAAAADAAAGVVDSCRTAFESPQRHGAAPAADAVHAPMEGHFAEGRSGRRRSVCYLVDCSGSMRGLFGRVSSRFEAMIRDLKPDEYFYVICFKDGRLFEFAEGHTIRATALSVQNAVDFISRVPPSGKTNVASALKRALRIRGKGGVGITSICLLTDGFELGEADAGVLDRQISSGLLEASSRGLKVDVLAFWPRDEDVTMLRRITERTGGKFVRLDD